jgi:NAD(P)-dependent dehydrogenase (short-subunit alcohol dehydrogenase family)
VERTKSRGGPAFSGAGSGSLIHFTSTAALIGNIAQTKYSAAKLGLSRSIATDMERFGVRSNCGAPTVSHDRFVREVMPAFG